MELKKLMEHISIIPDYRQAWKVELVRLGRRPADHNTERQNPHPDDLSAGELHATHQS